MLEAAQNAIGLERKGVLKGQKDLREECVEERKKRKTAYGERKRKGEGEKVW